MADNGRNLMDALFGDCKNAHSKPTASRVEA